MTPYEFVRVVMRHDALEFVRVLRHDTLEFVRVVLRHDALVFVRGTET